MAGKFFIKQTKSGSFRFNLTARNGQIIATSDGYGDLTDCEKGVERLRESCAAPVEDQTREGFQPLPCPKYEVYRDKAREFRFRLKAPSGEIIATGEGYVAKDSCLKGIASIRKNAPEARIEM